MNKLAPETRTRLTEICRASGKSEDEVIGRAIEVFDLARLYPSEFDWKKFEFVTTVQTGLISNAINRSLDDDAIQKRDVLSPATMQYQMSEAFRVADMLPDDVDARTAAWDFVMWTIEAEGSNMPEWFSPPDR